MTDLAQQIIEVKIREAENIRRDFDESFLKAAAFSVGREFRSLSLDIQSAKTFPLIPEFKSILFPGMIELEGFDPLYALKTLQNAGFNNGLVVATDPFFLGGNPGWINLLKSSTQYPIIQRDFFVDPVQIYQGKAVGADAIILDTAYVPGEKLPALIEAVEEMGLEAYLEVNDFNIPENISTDSLQGIIMNISDIKTLDKTTLAGLPKNCIKLARFFPTQGSHVTSLQNAGFQSLILNDLFWQQPEFTAAFKQILSWCAQHPQSDS